MSKKLCRESDRLEDKIGGRKMKYLCAKCDLESPKEKWCCKPRKIKQ